MRTEDFNEGISIATLGSILLVASGFMPAELIQDTMLTAGSLVLISSGLYFIEIIFKHKWPQKIVIWTFVVGCAFFGLASIMMLINIMARAGKLLFGA